jgi:hypothetical protein
MAYAPPNGGGRGKVAVNAFVELTCITSLVLFRVGKIKRLCEIPSWPDVTHSMQSATSACVDVCCSTCCHQARTLSSSCGNCPPVDVSLPTLELALLVSEESGVVLWVCRLDTTNLFTFH